jgi:hypothetical protein
MAKKYGFRKIGENLDFSTANVLAPKVALHDEKIIRRFIKLAKKLKRVAPKAEDFLYGHAVMMHAAEAALVDQETGEPILVKGKPAEGHFERFKLANGKESIKWISSSDTRPYKNANGDIFPEEELVTAYKKWVGKPLCKDHKSESVDGIRGIVIDTHYDPKFKRVHALFALDRKNYSDLARKIETGYANCVSMGTGVGRSICTECHNVAFTERDYCKCITARNNYGEINLDLSPIELSLVVNGADGLAKIRQIVASINDYANKKQSRINKLVADRCVNPTELQSLSDSVREIQVKLNGLMQLEKVADADAGDITALVRTMNDDKTDPETKELLRKILDKIKAKEESEEADVEPAPELGEEGEEPEATRTTMGGGSEYTSPEWIGSATDIGINPTNRLASRTSKKKEEGKQGALSNEICLLRSKIDEMSNSLNELKSIYAEDKHMNSARLKARARARRAYWLGGGGVNEPTPGKPKYEKEDAESIRDKEDKQMVGEPLETGSEGLHPGDEGKSWETRNLGGGKKAAELEERRMRRRAYWLGGGGLNEPTPGKEKYPKEDADSIRDKEDKQMVGEPLETGSDGMFPGDEPIKKKWLRARLRAKFTKVADDSGSPIKEASRWDVYAGDKLVLTASGAEIYEDELDANWDFLKSPEYGKALLRHIRNDGFEHTAYLLKGAQPPAAPAPAPAAPAPGGDLGGLDLGELGADVAPVAEEGAEGEVEVKQEKGETQQKVDAALNTMEEKIAEVRDLISGMESDELVDIDVNVDSEKKEEEAAPAPEAAPAAPAGEAPMEGVLASREDILKVEALMDLSADELAEASETLDGLTQVPPRVLDAVKDALSDSEAILTKANLILEAKKDKDDKDDKKGGCSECGGKLVFGKCFNEDCKKCAKKKDDDKDDKKDKKDKKEKKEDKDDEKKKEAQKLLDDALRLRAENRASLLSSAMDMMGDDTCPQCAEGPEMCACDMAADFALSPDLMGELSEEGVGLDLPAEDMYAKDKEEKEDKKDKKKDKKEKKEDEEKEDEENGDEDDAMYVEESPEMVLAARKSERDQLIAQAADILGKYELDLGKAENATEKTYFDAHPGGKGTVTELTHTKTPEAKVETISEVHDVMRDVAESGPRNVREAAMAIQEGIVKGAFKAEDLDRLVAEGKVDSAAASYWKKFWGMGPDTGSFGADMSKEFSKGKKEASDNVYRAKLRRAYDIGLEAQDKGLISGSRDSLDTYVDELMNFDDASFESTKRVVSSYSADKRTSGSVPRVGMDAATEAMTVTASSDPEPEVSQQDLLASLGWK